jgi:hypothetical protein
MNSQNRLNRDRELSGKQATKLSLELRIMLNSDVTYREFIFNKQLVFPKI